MEVKESKTKKHFWLSMFKSLLRFTACFALWNEEIGFAAIWFAIAEIIGVFEEL